MLSPLNMATEGYFCKGTKTLSIATAGYLCSDDSIDIITTKEFTTKKNGGSGDKKPLKYKPVFYESIYKETYEQEMMREDSEITTLIKIFLRCKN